MAAKRYKELISCFPPTHAGHLGRNVAADMTAQAVVEISHLDFRFDVQLPFVLRDVNMQVNRGSRTLLIGANGAGKSSLLRILAGRHFHSPSKCQILGRPAFHDTSLGRIVSHLGERWGYTSSGSACCSVSVCAGEREALGDLSVQELLDALDNPDWPRIRKLLDVLEVETHWRIQRLSDGQRRRVQLVLGLARKSELLLLDEVTTDLDVVARQNLLSFLKEESEQRGVTIIYATHIFDGLEHWATDVVFLSNGKINISCPLDALPALAALRERGVPAPLFRLVEVWLRDELKSSLAENGGKSAGSVRRATGFGLAERTFNTGLPTISVDERVVCLGLSLYVCSRTCVCVRGCMCMCACLRVRLCV